MKHLKIKSKSYLRHIAEFEEWLQNLNYSSTTIELYSNQVRELFYYLETQELIKEVDQIKEKQIADFHQYLKQRENNLYGGGLSVSHINGIAGSVNKLLEYLRLVHKITLHIQLQTIKNRTHRKEILTIDEVAKLLDSIDVSHPVGKRTKALIGLLYGTGIRKSELENIKPDDILFHEKLLHVRKGKGSKERLIPLTDKTIQFIQEYIADCRDVFEDVAEACESYLFIEITGKRMSESAIYKAIKEAIENSKIESLQEKKISPHTFRHSIASHLLERGMDIEDIAKFLGHNSLDTTMIYTHIEDGSI